MKMLAADLAELGTPHKAGRGSWAIGEQILDRGWDDAESPLVLVLRKGSVPILMGGNKRVSYIAAHGGGDIQIPVRIKVIRNGTK